MRKIRRKIFETNSSSVHSLSISKDGREKSYLPTDELGYILADYGSFGKNLEYYNTQGEKLSYLVTCCYYLSGYGDIYDCYEFQCIEDAVKEYTGAPGIKVREYYEPDIDHQSQPDRYDGIEIIDIYDKDQVIDFIFNKYVSLKTDCD